MPQVYKTSRGKLLLFTLEEAAEYLGICRRTMWQYVKDERIPAVMIAHKWYIWEGNLIAFLQGAKTTHVKHRVVAPGYHGEFL